MRSQRHVLYLSLAVVALTIAARLGTKSVIAQTYGATPATFHYTETTFDRTTGNPSTRKDSPMAIRSDGSRIEVRMIPGPDGKPHRVRTITDVTRRTRVTVDELTESLVTYRIREDAAQSLRLRDATCQAMEKQGTPEKVHVLGHRVFRTDLNIPSKPPKKLQSWYAPVLGCALVKEVLSVVDPEKGDVPLAMRELSLVVPGEPAGSLFELPPYPERRPSEMIRLRDQFYGNPGGTSQMILDQNDKAYLASQDNR